MKAVYRMLRMNYLLRGHRPKFAAAWAAHTFGIRHLAIRFDPVMACNLRCRMCYFSNDEYVKTTKGIFTREEIDRLAESFFPRALLVVYGCSTEPTLYKDFPELVKVAKRHKVPNVSLTTNAQLLKPEQIERLIDHGLDEITISTHGTVKETYEKFMTRASFENLHKVLRTLEEIKKRRGSLKPELRINYTVNAENLEELDQFFTVFEGLTISTLQVRPIMDINGEYRSPLEPGEVEKYIRIVKHLGEECHARGITFLANTADPAYQEMNDTSLIMQAVHRYIGPNSVWRDDFDWRKETYDQYCDRIGWSRHLLTCAMSSFDDVVKDNAAFWGKYSAKYEVNL